MRYDPNDRNQFDILIVPPGVSITEASIEHQFRTGYGGGHFVYFQREGETQQQTFARVREFERRDLENNRRAEEEQED